ncbi:hypothetical protein DMH04_22340 [Kibdelosporangium aridum]|uniref:Uncharacterized protein n=1 Tax=Kibdelosporangium aridum TaxID=2030 RepID=A0A428Z7W4_KIBAR|nr:hypothetical protein DMH04_22340 [Kibdelosporangium aridum]
MCDRRASFLTSAEWLKIRSVRSSYWVIAPYWASPRRRCSHGRVCAGGTTCHRNGLDEPWRKAIVVANVSLTGGLMFLGGWPERIADGSVAAAIVLMAYR